MYTTMLKREAATGEGRDGRAEGTYTEDKGTGCRREEKRMLSIMRYVCAQCFLFNLPIASALLLDEGFSSFVLYHTEPSSIRIYTLIETPRIPQDFAPQSPTPIKGRMVECVSSRGTPGGGVLVSPLR